MEPNVKRDGNFATLTLIVSIIVFSGAFLEQALLGTSLNRNASSAARALNSAAYILAYLPGLVLLIVHRQRLRDVMGAFTPILILSSLSLTSVLWALDPIYTALDALQLALTLTTSMGLAIALSPERFIHITLVTLAAILGASLLYILAFPDYGRMSYDGASTLVGLPQGVFTHKNKLAEVASLALLVAVCARGREPFWLVYLTLALGFGLLIVAQSAGKYYAFLLAVTIYGALRILVRLRFGPVLALFYAVLIFGALVLLLPTLLPLVLEFIGKDETLSGRTQIWAHALTLIADRPILGYGAGSIWRSELGAVPGVLYYQPPHAHNVMLDQMLMTGMVGTLLLAVFIVDVVRRGLQRPVLPVDMFFSMLTLSLLIRGMFDSALARGNQIGFLMMLAALGVMVAARRKREAQCVLER